jgi:hypothetical protein
LRTTASSTPMTPDLAHATEPPGQHSTRPLRRGHRSVAGPVPVHAPCPIQ